MATVEVEQDEIIFVTEQHDVRETGLQPGDDYVAWSRNQRKWILLKCKSVNVEGGWVVPDGVGYCFDSNVCYKVLEMKEASSQE